MSRLLAALLFLIVACIRPLAATGAPAAPQNDTDDVPQQSRSYADIVQADQPTLYWRFEDDKAFADESGRAVEPQKISGPVQFLEPGPRNDRFPLFEAENRAATFSKPASLRYDDAGAN